MYIEITLPSGERLFVRADAIATVTMGKTLKEQSPVVTTLGGASYSVTVENEKNVLARLVGMRG